MRRKKEYAFEDGTLLIREGGKTNHIRIWPRPHAWYQRCDRSVKTEFAPLYRLIGRAPARRNRGTEENRRQALPFGHGATPKRRAFRLLRSTLPAELADILGEFPGFQWHPAVTLYYHPAARDLLDSNPALAFCLSNNRRFIQLQTQNPGEVDRMLGMRQKEILEWLEFPGSKSMIKIMRKLAPAAVTPRYVSTLRWIMRREEHAARMRHLPRLNAGVLEFFIAPEIRDRAAPRLLEEVAEDPAEDEEGCTARAMLNADRLHRDIHPDETFPVLNERQSVYAFYRRMQEEKGIRIDREREHPWAYGDRAFQPKPKAPIPGTSTIIICSPSAPCSTRGTNSTIVSADSGPISY